MPVNARWEQNGITVAGGNGQGGNNNQLNWPWGLFVDDDNDQTIAIADSWNHRIIQYKRGDTNGQVVAGGNGNGSRLDQLNNPTDVLIDEQTNSLIIADKGNRRVVQWSRRSGTKQGELLIENIECFALTMDEQRNLYISDHEKQEVRRYKIDRGDKTGTVVAGGNGQGSRLNQLYTPANLVVDRNQSLFVPDYHNNRVMKWDKGAAQGIVVAGGQGEGNSLMQISNPNGIFVDTFGTLYVGDSGNHRVTRWPQGSQQGTVVVGGNGGGAGENQFIHPRGLSFDRHGNLYVVDHFNYRVQRFNRI